jgi:hypothetical protein
MMIRNKVLNIEFKWTSTMCLICIVEMTRVVLTFERQQEKHPSLNCPVKKVKLSLCLTNSALSHEGVWGSGCIDPYFLDLGTSRR